jgi:hypothetical protein
MSVEIPFGFKRVWQSNANFGDCQRAKFPSLTGLRLFPTEPAQNRYG